MLDLAAGLRFHDGPNHEKIVTVSVRGNPSMRSDSSMRTVRTVLRGSVYFAGGLTSSCDE